MQDEILCALQLSSAINTSGKAYFTPRFPVDEHSTTITQLKHSPGLTLETQTPAVNQQLTSLWVVTSIQPLLGSSRPQGDEIAGDYRTADDWIELHNKFASPQRRSTICP
jgi:hypothetical protein